MTSAQTPADDVPLLADHLALDLLNTEARKDGRLFDYWRDGDDVLRWLERQGISLPAQAVDRAALLRQARALRSLARRLIDERKEGRVGDVEALNPYLDAYLSAPHLERGGDGHLRITRIARGEPVALMLGPVAEALAQLVAEGDFALVKQCEHPDCILHFYDRTKAHKRRWCSMSTCGNRFKAAQFRKKSGADKA